MRDGEEERFAGVTHFTQVDVQPGGINIQHVENLYQADILKSLGIELEVKRRGAEAAEGTPECPAQLDSAPARVLWHKAQDAGWVNEERQPLLSRPLAALLADRMAEVLGIVAKWKAFEQLWQRSNMRNDYNTAISQQQCDQYRKMFKLKICL